MAWSGWPACLACRRSGRLPLAYDSRHASEAKTVPASPRPIADCSLHSSGRVAIPLLKARHSTVDSIRVSIVRACGRRQQRAMCLSRQRVWLVIVSSDVVANRPKAELVILRGSRGGVARTSAPPVRPLDRILPGLHLAKKTIRPLPRSSTVREYVPVHFWHSPPADEGRHGDHCGIFSRSRLLQRDRNAT